MRLNKKYVVRALIVVLLVGILCFAFGYSQGFEAGRTHGIKFAVCVLASDGINVTNVTDGAVLQERIDSCMKRLDKWD